eukprot:3447739-Rhodomonas_salina.1
MACHYCASTSAGSMDFTPNFPRLFSKHTERMEKPASFPFVKRGDSVGAVVGEIWEKEYGGTSSLSAFVVYFPSHLGFFKPGSTNQQPVAGIKQRDLVR